MKRAKSDYEVTAPNGGRFVVGWAPPREVERTFGRGRWGVEVMQRHGPLDMRVVDIQEVGSESEGQTAIRDLVTAIAEGRWRPSVGGVKGARYVRQVPRQAVPLFVFVVGFAGLVGFGGGLAAAAVGGAILSALVTAARRRRHP
jgi:hypothetical protein